MYSWMKWINNFTCCIKWNCFPLPYSIYTNLHSCFQSPITGGIDISVEFQSTLQTRSFEIRPKCSKKIQIWILKERKLMCSYDEVKIAFYSSLFWRNQNDKTRNASYIFIFTFISLNQVRCILSFPMLEVIHSSRTRT